STTGISTPMGEIVIVRAMSTGYVQIAGPSMTAELTGIRDELFDLGCARVFIDGAISRKSLGAPHIADGVILCSGASYDVSMRKTAEDTAYVASLFSLPTYSMPAGELDVSCKYHLVRGGEAVSFASLAELSTDIKNGFDALIVMGAFTDRIAAELLNYGKLLSGGAVVAEDASRLLLGRAAFGRLSRAADGFAVIKGSRLLAVTVNPFSAYGNHYDKSGFEENVAGAIRSVGIDVPVINVTEV
ncbi:MAG: hypothetical protein J5827_05200, partial [Oscillospiraceae bacterium]|nr:hypothetical protein [Oscillospiraceae bacterium]